MKPRLTHTPTETLAWLTEHHPELRAVAEIDRNWVWLCCDLRGDEATRKSLKEFGFVFSRRGGHPLPSGKVGTWGNSCTHPLPFYRKKMEPTRITTGAATYVAAPTTEEPEPELEDAALELAELT